jgi:tetratricopeptide (TPR) repeat protein
LKKAIALQPRFPESHFELGQLLEQSSDWKGAAAAYEQAARLAPKNPAPNYRLIRVYARLGLPAKSASAKQRHEALAAAEKAEADKRQAATKHMDLRVRP